MATSRNFTNCSPSFVANNDLPAGFDGDVALCGISYPQTTPFENISACCSGPVLVSNGCFQYCQTVKTPSNFVYCAQKGLQTPVGATCNTRASTGTATRLRLDTMGIIMTLIIVSAIR